MVLAPIDFDSFIDEMQKNRELVCINFEYYGKDMKKYLPLKEADLDLLSAREGKHIDAVLERLSDKNAIELSDLSHKDIPWIIAEKGEILDYESVFYRTCETSVRVYSNND